MNTFEEQDYTKNFDLSLWKKLIGYLKPYKGVIIRLIIFMMFTASVDAIIPLMTEYAIDNFIAKSTLDGVIIFGAVYIGLVLFQAVNIYSFIICAGKIEVGLVYDIRKMGFKKLQRLSFSYFDKTPVGWMMARMTSDAQRIGDVIAWCTVDLVWGVALIILISTIMLIKNLQLGLITLSVIPVLALASMYFQAKILKSQREVRKTNSKITGAFNEGISGARTTKTLVSEDKNLEDFTVLTKDMYKSSVRAAIYSSIYYPVVMSLGSIGVSFALIFGGRDVMIGGLSLGTLTVFINFAMLLFEPIQQIARVFSELQSAQASAERTLSLVEQEVEIDEPKEVVEKYGDAFNFKTENWEQIKGNILFKDVTFKYNTGEEVLKKFDLKVNAGQTIALVGETGSGKSTIVNLICRFYEPTEGKILIDGIDYRERPQVWLQANLGYVLQSPHLFSGTIRENVRYGRLDATDEEVDEAVRLVHADEFISKLEKGMDTDVGEGGGKLSTGEKQLISFARAILANPKIFVLDEATSSIDTETEQLIQKAIETVLFGRTSFIIAHRLSTIRSADRILVIDNGEVVEDGTHKELIHKRGVYYNLYTNQFKEEKEQSLLNV